MEGDRIEGDARRQGNHQRAADRQEPERHGDAG
jgi:hypothetical protein